MARWSACITARDYQVGLRCHRRRRQPKVRQERGRLMNQSRSAPPAAAAPLPPEGAALYSPAGGRQVLAALAASVTVLGRGSATLAGDRRRWGGGAKVSGVARGAWR